jgi:uncharacterized protein YlaI
MEVFVDRVKCKVCSSRYERTFEYKTWRNADQAIYECDVCGNVVADYTRSGLIPRLMIVWRGSCSLAQCAPLRKRKNLARSARH